MNLENLTITVELMTQELMVSSLDELNVQKSADTAQQIFSIYVAAGVSALKMFEDLATLTGAGMAAVDREQLLTLGRHVGGLLDKHAAKLKRLAEEQEVFIDDLYDRKARGEITPAEFVQESNRVLKGILAARAGSTEAEEKEEA